MKDRIVDFIDDFVNSHSEPDGCGAIKGNRVAIQRARSLSTIQRKKWRHHEIVPAAIVIYLREDGYLWANTPIPRGGCTLFEFRLILNQYGLSAEHIRSECEHRERRRIMDTCYPVLSNASFALRDDFWKKWMPLW